MDEPRAAHHATCSAAGLPSDNLDSKELESLEVEEDERDPKDDEEEAPAEEAEDDDDEELTKRKRWVHSRGKTRSRMPRWRR